MKSGSLEEALADLFSAAPVPPHMALIIHNDADAVELILDTSRPSISEWIRGEGADIALHRDQETGKVVGVRLPLYQKHLTVDWV